MKIGFILTTFPCRTETFALGEIDGLRGLGFDISIFAAAGEPHTNKSNETGRIYYRPPLFSAEGTKSICCLPARYPLGCCRLIRLILGLVFRCPKEAVTLIGNLHTIGFFAEKLDEENIFHIHAYFLSWPAVIGTALSVTTNRPFSISAHARDIFVEHGDVKTKVSRAKFVITCTLQGLRFLKSKLPVLYHHKLNLCYHGTSIVSEYRETKHTGTIIAVGRLVPKKGFETLLRAFASVIKEKPDLKLKIVGDGPLRSSLTELIKQLSLAQQVELSGWRDYQQTQRLISRAAVLIAPSVKASDGDRDGIANVIIEAFANHTPVIASRLEGLEEAAEHRQNALLVEPGNVTELAAAIKELINDEQLQSRLSEAAYETVTRRFDSNKNVRRMADCFINTN